MDDRQTFEAAVIPAMREAVHDLSWLLSRSYADSAAVTLVGDRYQLDARQREAVRRCSAGDAMLSLRDERRMAPASACGRTVLIDGYNVLTTVSSAKTGRAIIVGRDGCFRDLAARRGKFDRAEILGAARDVFDLLAELGVARARWLFDEPVSGSGEMASRIRAMDAPFDVEASAVPDPDAVLLETEDVSATSDSRILEGCRGWIDLATWTIERLPASPWIVDLRDPDGAESRRVGLNVTDHRRDVAGLEYVYPVVSRRAGGVSVGVNLNPNNACNWRCVYCQVPDLVRGAGPDIDLDRLRTELDGMLRDIVDGDFLEKNVEAPYRHLKDIAFSGNGEPTSSPQFAEAVAVVEEVQAARGVSVPVVVITNGSLLHQERVREGLRGVARLGGEIWFKLDTGTDEGLSRINGASTSIEKHLSRLRDAASLCPTWIQTCLFGRNGEPPSGEETTAYLAALKRLVDDGTPLRGVLLYGIARPSMQPEAPELFRLEETWMQQMEASIASLGLTVRMSR